MMKRLLIVDAKHIKGMISTIAVYHRMARSLDFLGSALKVVAGTPDAHDLESIKFTEVMLVVSNNRQNCALNN